MKNREEFLDEGLRLGTWLSSGAPVVSEMAAQFSFDWFLLDLEHGSGSEEQLLQSLRAMSESPARLIVRVPGFLPEMIGRVLDWGADGIMLPHVSSAQQAIDCVAAMRYPPVGWRGYSSTVRAYRYGLDSPENPQEVKPLCFAQIEDVEGVRNVHDIAAVDGVDVLFVGPADLKLALNHQPPEHAIDFEEALRQVAAAAKVYGKKAGILLRDRHDFVNLLSIGYSCIAIDSDLGILRKGYQGLMAWYKQVNV